MSEQARLKNERYREAEREAQAFNEQHPVCTEVRYWKGARNGPASGTGRTRSEAAAVCGRAVVWITGVSGFIALSHVEVLNGYR